MSDALNVNVIDKAYSRFKTMEEFTWPLVENCNVSLVPPFNNTMDFFYLYRIKHPEMHLESPGTNSLWGVANISYKNHAKEQN